MLYSLSSRIDFAIVRSVCSTSALLEISAFVRPNHWWRLLCAYGHALSLRACLVMPRITCFSDARIQKITASCMISRRMQEFMEETGVYCFREHRDGYQISRPDYQLLRFPMSMVVSQKRHRSWFHHVHGFRRGWLILRFSPCLSPTSPSSGCCCFPSAPTARLRDSFSMLVCNAVSCSTAYEYNIFQSSDKTLTYE